MTSTKLLVVLGATGNQGGSVVDSFLEQPGWRIRGISRNPSSAKARALQGRGVEVAYADFDSADALDAAFQGANAIFAVSDFWSAYQHPANKDKVTPGKPLNAVAADYETGQLKRVIDAAAKVTTLERFILSSLSHATKWSKGKYMRVFHFDSKANAEEYGRQNHPELWAKTSIFQAGYFLNNFVHNPLFTPVKVGPQVQRNLLEPESLLTTGGKEEGVVKFIGNLDPDFELPFIAPEEDSGPFVAALVREPPGKNIIAYREWITFRQFVQAFAKVTGYKAEVVYLPRGQYHNAALYPTDLRLQFDENWAYWKEFGYEGRDDPSIIHPKDLDLPPRLDDVEGYFKKQDWSKILGE